MIDIEQIRREADSFRGAIAAKRIPLDLNRLLQVDEQRRLLKSEVDQLRQKRNRISELVAGGSSEKEKLIVDGRLIGEALSSKERELEVAEVEFARLMAFVPGLPCPGVPEGETDQDNIEISRWGTPQKHSFVIRDHIELAAMHGMIDFDGARQIAGSRA